jgi:hypothetical protein
VGGDELYFFISAQIRMFNRVGDMQNDSAVVLQKLLMLSDESQEKGKGKRLTELLKDTESKDATDWYMYVPHCFNNALDIRLTARKEMGKETLVWTQGSAFSFKQGDTLYDTPKGYSVWNESLKHISLCVTVIEASDSIPEKRKTKNSEATPRCPGSLTIQALVPNSEKTELVKMDDIEMTQDEFVAFLVEGPDENLRKRGIWKR